MLLPLRVFLGVTFVYAGLSKLLDRHYLDGGSVLGVRAQMLRAAATSPIGGLVRLSAAHATTTGLLLAFGELAAGLGVLLGLMTRVAALGGMLLALSYYLTVSWRTSPYFYGPDIVFLFGWTPLLLAGDGGVYSVTGYLRARERERLRPTPKSKGRQVAVAAAEVERRAVLRGSVLAGLVGAVTVIGGGALALLRRGHTPSGGSAPRPAGTSTPVPTAPTAAHGVIAAAASVPVGGSVAFTAPDGRPAYLLHPTKDAFRALSAVCTHQGCTVEFDGSAFQCPCHGSTFDQTGQVTAGPAPVALPEVRVRVVDGNVVTS